MVTQSGSVSASTAADSNVTVGGQQSPRHSPRFASLREDGAGGRQSPMPCSSSSQYPCAPSGHSPASPRDSPRPSSSRDHFPMAVPMGKNASSIVNNNNFPPEMFGKTSV